MFCFAYYIQNPILHMASKSYSFTKLALFFTHLFLKYSRNQKDHQRSLSNAHVSNSEFITPLSNMSLKNELSSNNILIFIMEEALLRSSSVFSYFVLVAFEGGSLIRAFLLFLLYPFVLLVSKEMGLKIMVMVCFFGVKKDSFRVGSAILPKFFLEDVGEEGFEVIMRGDRKVGVSGLPRVMVECFLKDYLEVDFVFGRELKVICGYFVGVMDGKKNIDKHLEEMLGDEKVGCNLIGICNSIISLDSYCFSHCKEIYLVNEVDKKNWHPLPKERFPKPLIFHDGRLAFKPTPLSLLAMFMWLPFGITLAIIRLIIGLTLPHTIALPMLACTGIKIKHTKPPNCTQSKGLLYVCNHRTLMDPLCLSLILKKNLSTVTYSLSRVSEILAPIKTVRLKRDRNQDEAMMKRLLKQGDLVVCPEGTTCREPYLLRFSPLFSELNVDFVPVGMNTQVSLFYATTAGGLKCLDPVFFLMNPYPIYTVRFLNMTCGKSTCGDDSRLNIDVANHVQMEIGKTLGFKCTKLTRKDKYLILAGNEGIVSK